MAAFSTEVHAEQKFRIGTRVKDRSGNEFIYLKGVTSTIADDAVTYAEAGVTTLLAANAIGPVAFAGAAIDAVTKFGWYCVWGNCLANVVANSADNATIGRETTDGKVGDGRAAGDEILNAIARGATTTAAKAYVQINYPYVNDKTGS